MIQTGMAVLALAGVLSGGGGLPKGFLPSETHPPATEGEAYKVSDSLKRPLALNPCFRAEPWDTGRVAARSVVHESASQIDYEQLVLYRNTAAAERAMRGLRAQLARCADVGQGIKRHRYFTKPLDVGDDGLRAGGRFYESGEQAVVVRRGAAVYVAGAAGEPVYPSRSLPLGRFRELVGRAERMAEKVCELPEASCR
ncbi:hypothetical protein GCM10010149_90870 [Nonomuraea roseoviolacea subsp. roseoviolacea]|uniref:Sensor domain-containing protein n=1 Tax=Nonomuraea roseoviolacea subsp. carminata TaxID=160689 RepID=A0ABT1K3Q6_9ACTN|nr:hypothetical protein [Nonomuraea roseoviolacea]MCP2348628.1 hypothetical protein [Nonomuraea roseoviolacea subsp. carminata]